MLSGMPKEQKFAPGPMSNVSAQLNSNGDWLHSERKMKYEEMPGTVKDGFEKSRYTDWEMGSVYEINKNMETLQYRILVKKSGVQKKYLYFDTNGKLNRESLTL